MLLDKYGKAGYRKRFTKRTAAAIEERVASGSNDPPEERTLPWKAKKGTLMRTIVSVLVGHREHNAQLTKLFNL